MPCYSEQKFLAWPLGIFDSLAPWRNYSAWLPRGQFSQAPWWTIQLGSQRITQLSSRRGLQALLPKSRASYTKFRNTYFLCWGIVTIEAAWLISSPLRQCKKMRFCIFAYIHFFFRKNLKFCMLVKLTKKLRVHEGAWGLNKFCKIPYVNWRMTQLQLK